MEKDVSFSVDEIKKIDFSEYDEDEYMGARMGYISTRPNSHEIVISEDVLRASAPSALGKWIVAKTKFGDAGAHEDDEIIVGLIPKDQDVEFVEDKDGYLRAYVDCILSKRYARDFCDIFSEEDSMRAVSIEAKFDMDDDNAIAFDICGVTCLGKRYKPSCPESEIAIVRFSEEDAETYYEKMHEDKLAKLKQFVDDNKSEYVSHPINTSKDAIYTGEWDGQKAKQDLVKEKNYKTLAKKVCMKLEPGWENREVTKLGYPVMGLYDGEWRYSTKGLASALGYAKKENETEVISKIEKIYKKLDMESEGKEEKMAMEIEFAAVDVGNLWGRIWHEIDKTRHWEYEIVGIYEEDNKKFAILRDHDMKLYRLDFSLTEDGMSIAEEVVEVKQEFVKTDNMQEFAEPENVEQYRFAEPDKDDKEEHEMSADEMKAEIARLLADVEEKQNIIMDKDSSIEAMTAELEELRAYKEAILAKERAMCVEAIMSDVKSFVDDEQYKSFREEGLACKEDELEAWTNKVKATCFSEVKKNIKKDDTGVFSFAAPENQKTKKSTSIWERLKNQ